MTSSNKDTVADCLISCPCQTFGSIQQVTRALDTDERTRTLIQWLSGAVDEAAFEKTAPLSCAAKRCRGRVTTSLFILNTVRDACRPFLEATSSNSGSGGVKKETPEKIPEVYEESFPSLGLTSAAANASKNANVLVGRKKVKGTKSKATSTATTSVDSEHVKTPKVKRRIRPAAVTAVSVTSVAATAAWGAPTTSFPKGNLVNLPSEEPLELDSRFQSSCATQPQTAAAPTTANNMVSTWKKTATVADTTTVPNAAFATPSKKPAPRTIQQQETQEEIAAVTQMKNLVSVYCTLIKSCLVPSSVLELHLLIRLLTVSSEHVSGDASNDKICGLASILSSTSRCLYFAAQSLRQLAYILRGIGPPLLRELVRCPPFCTHVPELASQFELYMEEQAARGIISTSTLLAAGNQTAILTLPFNQERDSRHNYKSREDQALYKNREESRDAFLYQLRAFLSVRGKVVDSIQADKAIRRIQTSSRVVVDGVKDGNMFWFAEFFYDLLLQIGLVPLEETDKDLLSIADKDKLQKLHKRFSSRASQTNKSSRKVVAAPKNDAKAASPVDDAQHYFTGHQEFFYIFIMSADSYVFGIHLRSKMVSKLLELSSGATSKDFEKRLMDLQLVARFLGVLIFSPNWQASGAQSALPRMPLTEASDGFEQLGASGLTVVEVVEKAWTDRNLVAVVPWVVEILRMATWDRHVKHSRIQKRLLGLLRRIQERLNADGHEERIEPSCRQLVVLSTESLFDEVAGLTKISSLEAIGLPAIAPIPEGDDASGIDCSVTAFSVSTLDMSNGHVQELISLVTSISRVELSSFRSPGASRKLRPSIVASPMLDSVYTNARSAQSPPLPTGNDSTANGRRPSFSESLAATEASSIQSRLRDTFFHQHGGLKEVCDFAVNRVLRIATDELPAACIRPVLRERFSNEAGVSAAEKAAVLACTVSIKTRLKESLHQTIPSLTKSATSQKVLGIACSLSVAHGLHAGTSMINALVAAESRMLQATIARDEKRQLFAAGTEPKEKTLKTMQGTDYLTEATIALMQLVAELAHSEDFANALASVRCVVQALDELSAHSDSQIPTEKGLRSLFESVLLLDQSSLKAIEWSLVSPSPHSPLARWTFLDAYLLVAVKLTRFSQHGLRSAGAYIANTRNLSKVVALGISADAPKTLPTLLVGLVRARLVRASVLEDTLISARVVARGSNALSIDEAFKECLQLAPADPIVPFDMPRLREHIEQGAVQTEAPL